MKAKGILPMLILLLLIGLPGAVHAADAEFSRALNVAGCVPARVDLSRHERGTRIYEVTCLGNPPRSVAVLCTNVCTVSRGGSDDNASR